MKLMRIDGGCLRIDGISLDPGLTLIDSAQAFQWRMENGAYTGCSCGRRLTLIPLENGIMLQNCRGEDQDFWIDYLDLGRDYGALYEAAASCPTALCALKTLPGLRVLNQPAWETLVAFIISANNNVARIRGIVARLCAGVGGGAYPAPDRLASCTEDTLRAIGLGYRAGYLIAAARSVAEGFDLDGLRRKSYEEAHEALKSLPGVGDKVADCVQLFGLRQPEAFPVDVWIERVMKKCAPQARTKSEIRKAARDLFGSHAGLIQQSLFHCARMGLIDIGP